MLDNFILEIVNGIAIEKVNIIRVTVKEIQEFKETLSSIISNGYNKIIIDFSECNYVDSSVIGLMITTVRELRSSGGDIKLIMPENGNILNVFAQTGLNKIFDQFSSRELTLASFIKKI